jgi:putative hydrolase of the HAD superfamily
MSTAVCFDLDGTVVEFTDPYDAILDGTFDTALGHTEPELIETYNQAFYDAFQAFDPDPYLTGARAVCDRADADTSPDALVTTLREREFAAATVSDDTRSLLDALGGRHRLAVVTNGVSEWQRAKLRHHGLYDRFDAVVCSYEVGAHKPDSAPFEAAKTRLDAGSYVMIGDDYEADIEGARNAGFVPIHLVSDAPAPRVPNSGSLETLLAAFR